MGILSNGTRARRALAGMGLAAILSASLMATPALADSRNVATYGVDLTPDQRAQVERFFGAGAVDADVIYVNNDQERAYLSAYIPLEQIGDKTYSCALVQPTLSGGIHVKTANLTYVTSDMIAATLATSGVRNCDVIAVCPFKVSGTGALTGVLMAYEQASGQTLDPAKKDLANQELITTGTIAQTVGPDMATLIVNDVKATIIQESVTEVNDIDTVVTNVVNNIVNDYSSTNVDNSVTNVNNTSTSVTVVESPGAEPSVQLSDEEMQALKDFAHALADQGYDYDDVKETLEMVSKNASQAAGVEDPMASRQADEGGASSTAADLGSASDAAAASSGSLDGTVKAPGSASDGGASADPSKSLDGAAASQSQDVSAQEPEELSQDSILNQTDDLALGEGTVVDSTDLSTIGEGVETRQEAEAAAQESTGQAAEPDPDDPFAGLTWDETTTGSDGTAVQPEGQGQSAPAGDATAGVATPDDSATGDATANAADPATDAGTVPSVPLAGEMVADTSGFPATATGSGVTLTLGRVMGATSLLEDVPGALVVYQDAAGPCGIMAADGTRLTEATYAPGGIEGVGDGWVMATTASGATDIYRQAAAATDADAVVMAEPSTAPDGADVTADVALAATRANLTRVATVQGAVMQTQSAGDCLNIQTQDGAFTALDANGVVAGVVPAAIDDFSYAPAPAGDSMASAEAAAPADAVVSADAGLGLEAGAATEAGDMAELVETTPAADAAPAVRAIPETLPADAREIAGTDGALWLLPQPTGKKVVSDIAGMDILAMELDSVQVSGDGGWLLVTDFVSGKSALYRVQVAPVA